MHIFKRYFLLAGVILALLIPLNRIEIPFDKSMQSAISSLEEENTTGVLQENFTIDYTPVETLTQKYFIKTVTSDQVSLSKVITPILITVYLLGFLFFLLRFYHHIKKIYSKIQCNYKIQSKENTKVLLKETTVPHSFLQFMFLNRQAFENRAIAPEVLIHEQAHIDQRHTLDILLLEALQTVFWFNPLFYWIKRSAKLNHEFLADQKVVSLQNPVDQYQNILLQFAGNSQYPLTSNINYSLTKKRLQMMTKRTSRIRSITWVLALIPVILGLVLFLSSKVAIAQDIHIKIINKNEVIINDSIHTRPKNISSEIEKIINDYSAKQKENITAIIQAPKDMEMGFVIDLNEKIIKAGVKIREYTSDQKTKDSSTNKQVQKDKTFNGASEKMMKEYQNFMIISKQNGSISHPEYVRIIAIYQLMNINQKASVKKYHEAPVVDLSKTQPKTPSEKDFNSWKNKEEYAVWVDKKHVDNKFLNNYTASDFVYFTVSKVYKNARSKNFPQPYQVSLYTAKSFEETFLKFNVNEYKTLLNKYITERNLIFRNPEKDIDEVRILYQQLENLYKILSLQEKEKYNIIMAPPVPKLPIQPNALHLDDHEPPPLPPQPASLEAVIKAMSKKNADFYYKNKKISSEEALKISKEQSNLGFTIKGINSKSDKPIVKISKK